MQAGLVSRVRPVVRWWPRFARADGVELYNVVILGEEQAGVVFVLEFDGLKHPANPRPLPFPALVVRADVFEAPVEVWSDYLRQTALHWLAAGCVSEQQVQLRSELSRWRARQGYGSLAVQRGRSPWTSREETQLLSAAQSGASVRDLARLHGRSQAAIKTRLHRLAPLGHLEAA